MTVKLVQYFVQGEKKEYKKLANLSKEINKKYCQIHNYSFQFEYLDRQLIIEQFGQFNWDMVAAYKLYFIREQLYKSGCDYIVYIDADAAVNKPQIAIEDLIDEQHQLFLSRANDKTYVRNTIRELCIKLININNTTSLVNNFNYDQEIVKQLFPVCQRACQGWNYWNEGLFVIKNTDKMKQFFTDCVDALKFFMNRVVPAGRSLDGLLIDFILLQKKYFDCYTMLPYYAQGGVFNTHQTKYDLQTTFVRHEYGTATNMEQKIAYLEEVKNNKWWSEV